MFYSVDLLSLRRKGRLARCWLAATVSEKIFKKTCKPSLIKKIDVSIICEEILSTVEIRASGIYGRFSLYLSSQLMYGATKILFYQTIFFQDYLFELNRKLERHIKVGRVNDDFNAAMAFELQEVPPLSEVLRNTKMSSNVHLILESNYTSAVEQMMQDQMNFGVLTNFELEQLMLPGPEELSLEEIRKFCWDESENVPEDSVQVPPISVSGFDATDFEKETRLTSSRQYEKEHLIDVKDGYSAEQIPMTPKKRSLKSPTDTPSKKRKLIPEEVSEQPLLDEHPLPDEHLPLLEPIALDTEMLQLLPTETEEVAKITKQKPRKKLFDKQMQLSDTVMRKFIENTMVHTREYQYYTSTLPSANIYLTKPSIQISNMQWGITLTTLFNRHITGPFAAQSEVSDAFQFEGEQTTLGETIRAEASSKLQNQMGEISSKIAGTTINSTEDYTTTEIILPTEIYQANQYEEYQNKEHEEILVDFPEINVTEEKIGQVSEKSAISLKDKKSSSPKSSTSVCSKTCLIKPEVLALLEMHWSESRQVNFQNVFSPEHYTKLDAACAFDYCLEFHTNKILILKQSEAFQTIWIEKYPCYTSESDDDFTAS